MMSRDDGTALTEIEHIKQSIADILTTPIGTRVMRRDYGSKLFDLLDSPLNKNSLLLAYAYSAAAIEKWEPRFDLKQVTIGVLETEGRASILLSGLVKQTPVDFTVTV